MPAEMERELKKAARRKGLNSVQTRKFVYGAMRKFGWKPRQERKKRA